MIDLFSLENITTSAAVFNLEKLTWLNQQYIKAADSLELAQALEPILVQEQVLPADHDKSLEEIARIVPFLNERSETLVEMAGKAAFYFKDEIEFDEKARDKFLNPEAQPLLAELQAELQKLEPFTLESIESVFKSVVERAGLKLGKLAQPVRVALTGKKESPGIYDVVVLLGKERSCQRLNQASKMIASL